MRLVFKIALNFFQEKFWREASPPPPVDRILQGLPFTNILLPFIWWSNESSAMTILRAFSGMGRACD